MLPTHIQAPQGFDFEALLKKSLTFWQAEDHDDTEGYAFEPLPYLEGHERKKASYPPRSSSAKPKLSTRREKCRKNRSVKRDLDRKSDWYAGYKIRRSTLKQHILGSKPILTGLVTEALKVAKTGYVGLRDSKEERVEKGHMKKTYSLDELTGPNSKFGFKLIEWDGRTAVPLTDEKGRVIALLAGQPNDKSWHTVHEAAANEIAAARSKCEFHPSEEIHRRGEFAALSTGVSYGGGQMAPGNLCNTEKNSQVLESLLSNKNIRRIAGFASKTFSTWAPRLHEYQVDHLERLHKRHPKLRRNFQNGSWGAATFNFGPQTVCFDHRDHANLAFGWCSVTAMGKFDFKRCGHLILWDMGLVIQFPPGSTIMIPSATIRHSNVRLGKDGTRMSFTQFTAGGLFRWVDAGFRTSSKFLKQDRKGKAIFDEMLKDKWEMGLGLFSTLKELKRKKN